MRTRHEQHGRGLSDIAWIYHRDPSAGGRSKDLPDSLHLLRDPQYGRHVKVRAHDRYVGHHLLRMRFEPALHIPELERRAWPGTDRRQLHDTPNAGIGDGVEHVPLELELPRTVRRQDKRSVDSLDCLR
jgi:hypothetical protein